MFLDQNQMIFNNGRKGYQIEKMNFPNLKIFKMNQQIMQADMVCYKQKMIESTIF